MGEPAFDIYQGNDWLTYRATVAQAFDTLDRVRELCRAAPALSIAQGPGGLQPHYDIHDFDLGDKADVCAAILDLCDDLSGEIDCVQADLYIVLKNDVALRWQGFEMCLHLNEMREIAMQEQLAPEAEGDGLDAIAAQAELIRERLKRLDQ